MLATDMYQSPEVGIYTPRPYVKRQFTFIRYAEKTVFELMDIYLPEEGDGPFPVVIDLHGGGYFYGTRSSVRMEPVLELIKRGYVVVSIDYTLSPYGKFPLQVHEMKAAIRYLRANAQKYAIDPDRIGVWGLSAGAHLGVLAAVSDDVAELDDPSMGNANYSSNVQAVVDLYGPMDFSDNDIGEDEDPTKTLYGMLFGHPAKEVPELVRISNPCNYIKKGIPPVFIQHGNRDHMVNMQDSILLRDTICQKAGANSVTFEIVDGADHADALFRTPQNNRKIYEFLDKHLKK